jgi:pSer/pThr/pTyr-binding forkhead associated (FHA) protein
MNECPLCGASFPAGLCRCPECCIDFSSVIPAAGTLESLAAEPTAEARPAGPVEPPVAAVPLAVPFVEPPPAIPVAEPANPPLDATLPVPAAVVDQAPAVPETVPFRPVRRPPLALLCALDDGREEGEWYRIRTPSFIIGRAEGDLVIPHDSLMSSRHAEISRQLEKDRYRWYLTDLGSTNGSYLKIASVVLRHDQEVLIGNRRLRFHAAPQGVTGQGGNAAGEKTQGWQPVPPHDLVPSLVEVTPQGDGQRYYLTRPDNWIGRDPGQCSVVLANDPLVDARHARLYRDAKGRWRLDSNRALNGTWLRIDKVSLDGTGQFLLGEQRFLVKFP